MKKVIVVALATLMLSVSADATTRSKVSTCETAYNVRQQVIHKFNKRAPGRNICRQGMRFKYVSPDRSRSHWFTRPAKDKEKKAYLKAMRRLLTPAPVGLLRTAVPPGQPPAGTLSPGMAPTGLANCIISHESGGNPTATNGQYHGIAQWSPEAWARMGGRRFAADPINATYQQQLIVLGYGLAHYGCKDWCPYDGC